MLTPMCVCAFLICRLAMSYPHASPHFSEVIPYVLRELGATSLQFAISRESLRLACGVTPDSPIRVQVAFSRTLVTLIQMKHVRTTTSWLLPAIKTSGATMIGRYYLDDVATGVAIAGP